MYGKINSYSREYAGAEKNGHYSLNTVILQAAVYVALPLLRILQSHTNPSLQKQKDRLHLDHINILLT